MYHIKDDKRSITSANALYNALQTLLKTEQLNDISVSKLVRKAMIGRSTFYRNFDTILDVLVWKADSYFQTVLADYINCAKGNDNDQLDFIRYIFAFWEKHSAILEALIKVNRLDIIHDSFTRASPVIIDYMKHKNTPTDLTPTEMRYFLSTRISILIGAISTWIRDGRKESPEEIARILEKNARHLSRMNILY